VSFEIGITLTPLLLDFAEEQGEIEDLIHESNFNKFDANYSLQRVRDRLKGCCGGIFEVRSTAPPSENGMQQEGYNDFVVDAVHGTVWEFLAGDIAMDEINKHPPEESETGPSTSLIRSAILSLHFVPPTTKKNRQERAKICIHLVMGATLRMECQYRWNRVTKEEQDALGQPEKDNIRNVSKLISVFDQVGSKALEKTRSYFESTGKHWIYLVDEKLFDYFDDYESYMISWLLASGLVFCVEHLLFGM
jgi:hypothetical protein